MLWLQSFIAADDNNATHLPKWLSFRSQAIALVHRGQHPNASSLLLLFALELKETTRYILPAYDRCVCLCLLILCAPVKNWLYADAISVATNKKNSLSWQRCLWEMTCVYIYTLPICFPQLCFEGNVARIMCPGNISSRIDTFLYRGGGGKLVVLVKGN